MDPMPLDRLLDVLSKADTMLTDEPARAACALVAEALRTSWAPADPVRLLLVQGPDADPLVLLLQWLRESFEEDRDRRRMIASQLDDLLDEVHTRRKRLTSERDSLRADIAAFIRSVEIDVPSLPYEVQGWLEEELAPLRTAIAPETADRG